MRAMWRVHGKPTAPRPGYVAQPYRIDDAEQRLAEASGDAAFAHQFFARYIHGHEVPDFATLLARAGLVLRRQNPGRPWWGEPRLEVRNRLVIADTPLANTPAYRAGLDVGDQIHSVDGTRVTTPDDVTTIVRRHKPGDSLVIEYSDRTESTTSVTVKLEEDPRLELVTVESTGKSASAAQTAFRAAWLGRRGQ